MLKVTSGAIRANKSFIYPVGYQFKPNGDYSFIPIEDIDITLSVRNKYNKREELELIPAFVGKEILRIYLVPD